MAAQITVRLSEDLDESLVLLEKKLRLRRSDIVRMALRKLIEESQNSEDMRPYRRVKHLLGTVTSGIEDLGTNHRKYILRRIKRAQRTA